MVRLITSVAFANGQMTVVYTATPDTPSVTEVYPLNLITGPISTIDVDNMPAVQVAATVAGTNPTVPYTYPLAQRDGTHEATIRFADGRKFTADIRDIASPTYASAAAFAAAITAEAALAIN